MEEKEDRRQQREAHHREVDEERARKAEERARKTQAKAQKVAELARKSDLRQVAAGQRATVRGKGAKGPPEPLEEAAARPMGSMQVGARGPAQLEIEGDDCGEGTSSSPQHSHPLLSGASLPQLQLLHGLQFMFGNPFLNSFNPMQTMAQAPIMPNVTHLQQFPIAYPVQNAWPVQQSLGETSR